MHKVIGTIQKSSEVMKIVNNLVRLPEISKTMYELSSELTKVLYLIYIVGRYNRRNDWRYNGGFRWR